MEGSSSGAGTPGSSTFFTRHQFLIYRLFSLAGVVPVGGYLVIHLLTNATVLNGAASFQTQVDRIHSLGAFLPFVEWTFIFIPILFHAAVGWLIISGAVPNTSSYPYSGNLRYVLQRMTGLIAFVFILFHVIQLHHLGSSLGGGEFNPEHAASSAATAIDRALWIKVAYAIGILACVYHFVNGIWTAGITWGVWTSRAAQRRASYVVLVFGIGLGVVALSALTGMTRVDVQEARQVEDRMERARQYIDGKIADPSAPASDEHAAQAGRIVPAGEVQVPHETQHEQAGVATVGAPAAK